MYISNRYFLYFAFMLYTNELIEELLGCPKKVTNSPKDSGVGRGSSKIKFMLESIDGKYSFSGFISKNLTFQLNFSTGLVYQPKDERGTIVLLRVNGPHGPNENIPHHEGPHVHLATAERINAGLKPEGKIETGVPYATIEDAIQYFVKRINVIITDRQKHFPPPNNQIDINFEAGGNV
ncbi:hypothetical protein FC093_12710 [Ilyomonas limi]|uniref:Uncharacterized protein n=1 Tax=Ilyomonas limi TaxID=2575867 RepID=A0A4U3L3E7_9BACT|nr:hypothetical protein [Ilyomonas limi]TKK68067.1 hypothetical protein FC093_12710 [Ilyomonas limi]